MKGSAFFDVIEVEENTDGTRIIKKAELLEVVLFDDDYYEKLGAQ